MIDPSSLLKSADPLRDEPAHELLAPEDAQSIRRAMLASIPAAGTARPLWSRPFVLAAAAALVAAVSGILGHRFGLQPVVSPEEPSPAAAQVLASGGGERRQLQFSTPGGTRIIWIFDDSLRLQEPMP